MHPSGSEGARIGCGRPFPSKSSTSSFASLGHTITFINNWPQSFSENYASRTYLYKPKMQELFKKTPLYLTAKILVMIKVNMIIQSRQ